jgi:hypothetical protein
MVVLYRLIDLPTVHEAEVGCLPAFCDWIQDLGAGMVTVDPAIRADWVELYRDLQRPEYMTNSVSLMRQPEEASPSVVILGRR